MSSPLAVLTTWSAGDKLTATALNNEVKNVVDALNGTDNVNLEITYNSNDDATVEIINTHASGLGLLVTAAKMQQNAANPNFSLFSAAGATWTTTRLKQTADVFAIATNDGADEERFAIDPTNAEMRFNAVATDIVNFVFDGPTAPTLDLSIAGTPEWRIYGDGTNFKVQHFAVSYWDTLSLDPSAGTGSITADGGSAKDILLEGNAYTMFSATLYLGDGTPATGQHGNIFVVPQGATVDVRRASLSYIDGTPTGSTSINIHRYDSAGFFSSTVFTPSLLSGTGARALVTHDATLSLAAGDQLIVDVTATGGHEQVSVTVEGRIYAQD